MISTFALRHLILATALTLLPFAANAGEIRMGGSDGTGGNTQKSSRADLEEIVANMRQHVWSVSEDFLSGGTLRIPARPLKPQLSKVTQAVLGTPYFAVTKSVEDYINGLKFDIVDGDCTDGGEATDSSTPNRKNAPICLSATRLSRFPKTVLKQALMPLIFHEVAHQFGFSEKEATALQELADLHLKYQEIYIESHRARVMCAAASTVPWSEEEKKEIVSSQWSPGQTVASLEKALKTMTGSARIQALMACAARSMVAGESLKRIFNGSVWQKMDFSPLSSAQAQILLAYQGSYKEFTFLTMIRALTEPPISSYSGCSICNKGGVDPAYLMSLGARVAMKHVAREVSDLQDRI